MASSRRSVRKTTSAFTTPQILHVLRSVRDIARRDNKIDNVSIGNFLGNFLGFFWCGKLHVLVII